MCREHHGAPQVLIGHSHGGTLCQLALQQVSVRKSVAAVVFLATPFIHPHPREDAGRWTRVLGYSSMVVWMAFLFGSIYLASKLIPEPWDTWVLASIFMVLAIAAGIHMGLSEGRRQALRAWTRSLKDLRSGSPPAQVLLSDGDEALFVLKTAEAMSAAFRLLWQALWSVPDRVFALQRRFGDNVPVALTVYALASAGVFFLLAYSDVSSPWGPGDATRWSFVVLAKIIVASLLVPAVALFLWCQAIALPALLVLPLVFAALVAVRWLGFEWGGTIDVDITAEACPVGTTSVTRRSWQRPRRRGKKGPPGSRADPRYAPEPSPGLRHCNVYDDRRAPVLIARFIRETLNRR